MTTNAVPFICITTENIPRLTQRLRRFLLRQFSLVFLLLILTRRWVFQSKSSNKNQILLVATAPRLLTLMKFQKLLKSLVDGTKFIGGGRG